MKIETKTVYACEYCGKLMFGKGSMSYHEKWCTLNPVNKPKCSNCVFIENITIKYGYDLSDYDYSEYEYVEKETAGFRCSKLDELLYPKKVEKKKLPEKYPETFENQKPMPVECKEFKENSQDFDFSLVVNY
jgi:hypothetical protein